MPRGRHSLLFLTLLAITLAAFLFALSSGSADIGFGQALDALRGQASEQAHALVVELRLPRALTAFAVGGLLAVAGVLMQVLLRNPLAEPYILGSSGGAFILGLEHNLLQTFQGLPGRRECHANGSTFAPFDVLLPIQ